MKAGAPQTETSEAKSSASSPRACRVNDEICGHFFFAGGRLGNAAESMRDRANRRVSSAAMTGC